MHAYWNLIKLVHNVVVTKSTECAMPWYASSTLPITNQERRLHSTHHHHPLGAHPRSQPHSASPIYVTSSSAIQFACTSTHGSNPSKTLLEPHKGSDYPRHQISESGADSALEWSQTRSWACWKRSLYPLDAKTCPTDPSYEVCYSKPIPDHICVL